MGISTINPLERITPRCACRSHSPIITAKVQRFLSQPFFVWDSEFWKLNRFIRTNRKAQATIFSSKAVDFSQSYHFGATSHGHNTMSRGCGDFHRHTWSLCGFGNHHQWLRGGDRAQLVFECVKWWESDTCVLLFFPHLLVQSIGRYL